MGDKEGMQGIWKKFRELCKKHPIKVIVIPEFKRK